LSIFEGLFLIITLFFTFLTFLINYRPETPYILAPSIEFYLTLLTITILLVAILYIFLAYNSLKLAELKLNALITKSSHRLALFYFTLSVSLLFLSLAFLVLLYAKSSSFYVVFRGFKLYLYPQLIAIASLWISCSAAFYFLFAYTVVFRKDNHTIFILYMLILCFTDYLVISPLNYYGNEIETITLVKILSRIFMLLLFIIPIMMISFRSYRNWRSTKNEIMKVRSLINMISNLLLALFFLLYLIDAFTTKPFSLYMAFAYTIAFLSLIGIYIATVFPKNIENIVMIILRRKKSN